jgi:hypothetical protein
MTRRLAYHEAGHAVLGARFGAKLECAQISDAGGSMLFDEAFDALGLLQVAIIHLAGLAAEGRACGHAERDLAAEDLAKTREVVSASVNLDPDAPAVDEHIMRIEALTDSYVATLWPNIEQVAEALLRSGTLAGPELTRLLIPKRQCI